jgi:probable rRNA maturation factor
MAKQRVSITCLQELVRVDRVAMREIVRTVLSGEGKMESEVSLVFVDNPTIQELNQRYLKHNEPTDVITFPLSEPGSKMLVGELVIGVEVARAEAANRGHDVQAELALYVIHGLLHLCGYDDRARSTIKAIREREGYYLRTLGLPEISPER